jgi:ATP-binding cassette subfamily F protein 3
LAGRRELQHGKLRTGHNVTIGFLSQHAEELAGGTARTVLEAAQHATKLTPAKTRALLGRFLFSGEDAEKPLAGLSGGERRRLSLAILVHSGANVLILDEPTNHLDLDSREALESALNSFSGSLLLVSHDRALLDAVGTRTIGLEDHALHSYVGGWPEYVRVREARAKSPGPAKASQATGPAGASGRRAKPANTKRNPPMGRKRGDSEQRLEQQIAAAEATLATIEDELSNPAAWATPEATERSSSRHEEAKRAVAELYERLEAVAG